MKVFLSNLNSDLKFFNSNKIKSGVMAQMKVHNKALNNDMDLIFTDLNTANTKVDLKKLTTKPTCVIIGPEGDFSEQERDEILKLIDILSLKVKVYFFKRHSI